MKNAYLAICYACNEGCRYCPCSKQEKKEHPFTPASELFNKIDELLSHGITDITVSGGEPTLHPQLADIVKYMQDRKAAVTILSNGERFSNADFRTDFFRRVTADGLKLITTIHSHISADHEEANCTPGSFDRTISGLKAMMAAGVRVIVKHCITKANYEDLPEFLPFILSTFGSQAEVQFCSIDYCGIPEDQLQAQKFSFRELQPFLEDTFDKYENMRIPNKLTCINIPLCSCDPYYWKYLPRKREKMYESYSDPTVHAILEGQNNVDISATYCAQCKVKGICTGTYLTAFRYFGSEMIAPIK